MDIAVLGTGKIGGTLARKWAARGHRLVLGAREPGSDEVKALLAELGSGASARTPAEAAGAAEVVLLAVPAAAVADLLATVGPSLAGRIVIDATNAIRGETVNSLDAIRAAQPDVHLARAFNSLGWENLADPSYGGQAATMFFVAEDGTTRETVERLVADVGLDPVWVGGIDQVDLVDNLLRLWITLAMGRGLGRSIGLRLLRR